MEYHNNEIRNNRNNGGDYMNVGLKIKSYLAEIGMSQKFLSFKSGIKEPKLNLALNGHRRLTFEEYEIICFVLNVGVDKFLEPRKPLAKVK